MTSARNNSTRIGPLALLAALALLLAGAALAQAASPPKLSIHGQTTTTAAPGGELTYVVQFNDVGEEELEGSTEAFSFSASMPPGIEATAATSGFLWDCSATVFPASVVNCTNTLVSVPRGPAVTILISATVDAGAAPGEVLTARFEASGGGDPATHTTVTPVRIATTEPGFGISAFDAALSADEAGTPSTQAAAHPYEMANGVGFNSVINEAALKGTPWPVEPSKDIVVQLPAGQAIVPGNVARCNSVQLANSEVTSARPLCPPASQVGTILLHANLLDAANTIGPIPVFNMVPPPGAPARFGFNAFGTIVTFDGDVDSAGDYGGIATFRDVSEGLDIVSSELTFWGVPASEGHRSYRSCPGEFSALEGGPNCAGSGVETAFLRNPTSCTGPGTYTALADSWDHPGVYDEASFQSHAPPGFPYPPSEWGAPQGNTGCESVPFNPSIEASTTTSAADSPSGLSLDIAFPQGCWAPMESEAFKAEPHCQSDLRETAVTLPAGMSVNPSSAGGLESCTPAQVGLTTPVGQSSPIHFDESPASCPDASKIGRVTIETPTLGRHDAEGNPVHDAAGGLVPEPLEGSVYLAQQSQNPFGSLLAMYVVAEGQGVIVKQAGHIETGADGRVTTTFSEMPQQPVGDISVELFGGQRAALRTPPHCGTYAVQATLTPWSGGAAVQRAAALEINGCGFSERGFDPKLAAGTVNPVAGATSPFTLRLTRGDGEQELGGLTLSPPPGISGYLKGIPYCSDAALASVSGDPGTGAGQEGSSSCPAASRLGTVTTGAGAGANPFYTAAGRAYLAGPYKGAPLSIAVIAPAVAGPFDLGSVVVRNKIDVDPETGRLTVASDPFPTILHGIPLDLRDVRVDLDRSHFTLNPTSCDEMSVDATVRSAQGASASPSNRFQVAGCGELGFKPKLGLKLYGKPGRGAHPKLRAVVGFPKGNGANLARAAVALPGSEILDQAHIRTICTRVQFAADGGDGAGCPAGSIYGYAKAWSPIVGYPVQGPVYLRSSSHKLPDMVLALRGPAYQPVAIDAVGRIDSVHGRIRSTFESTPDLPLSKVVLTMKGGRKGLLVNSINLCRGVHRARASLLGQNGKAELLRPAVQSDKCGGRRKRTHRRKAHRKHRRATRTAG
jgi:hypothetical protein